ncbi:hypothetical protein [Mesobacillus maritimus]|uniref:hypothetical protein n=1 Tax=Mesobacillus maritimus TaxID=1643336 RepID=UPI00384BBC5F
MYGMRNPHNRFIGAPFLFGGPFIGGVLGGLLGSAIIRPRPYPIYPPVPVYPPYPYGYGYGYGPYPYR